MVLGASAVSVQYSADGSAYTQTMGEMVTATGQFADVADGVVGTISKVGIATTKFAADTAAFGNATNIAVRQAAAYQQALQGLEIRAESAGKSFQSVGAIVRESARQSPVGLSRTIEQYEALFEMGVTAEKKLKPLSDSITKVQAATGNLGNQQFANNMLALGRTFDAMDPASIDNVSDSIVTMTGKVGGSATAVAGFANEIAPLSEQLGMTQTSVVGFANAFAKAGQDGGRAASVYTRMLSGMERSVREGTDGIKVYADAIGMSTAATKDLVQHNPAEAMAQMFDALSGRSSKEAIRTLERIGLEGPRSLKTISAVMSAGGVRSSLDAARGGYADDSSLRASEKALGGLNNELKKTQESMSQMIEASGRPFVGMLGDVAKGAAGISGVGAGVAGSDIMQNIGGAIVPMLAMGSFASKGLGLWSSSMFAKQGINSLPGVVKGAFTGSGALAAGGAARTWMGANRGLMVGGGAAGVAGGLAMDNPMLGTAGMMMMMGGLPGKFGEAAGKLSGSAMDAFIFDRFDMAGKTLGPNAAASRAGVAAPFGFSGGTAFRKGSGQALQKLTGMSAKEISGMFLTKGGGVDTTRLMKTLEDARLTDELSRADSAKAGLDATKTNTAALKETTAGVRASNDLYKETAPKFNRGAAVAARGVKGVPHALGASVVAGGHSIVSAAAAHPVVAGALGVGAVGGIAYWGNKQNEEQLEKARDTANSQTRVLAERYGLQLKEFDSVADEVKDRTGSISGWSDAFDVDTTLAMRMQGLDKDLGWELSDRQVKEATADELAYEIIRTGGVQGPQYVGSMIQDLAAQVGPVKAQAVADRVESMGVGSAESLGAASAHITDSASTGLGSRGWYGNTGGLFKNDYEGMYEQVDQGTSVGMQKATIISQKTDIGGPQAGAEQKLEFLDQLAKQIDSGVDINLEAVRAELGPQYKPEEVDSLMGNIEYVMNQRGAGPPMLDPSAWGAWGRRKLFGEDNVDLRGEVSDVVNLANEPIDNTELLKLGESKDFVSVQYEKLSRAANELGLTRDQLLELRREGSDSEYAQSTDVLKKFNAWETGAVHRRRGNKDEGSIKRFLETEMGITDDVIAVGRAVSTPDSPAAMMQARRASLATGQTAEQAIKGVTSSLVTEPSKALSQTQLAIFNQAISTQTQTEMSALSPGDALKYKMSRGKMMQKEGDKILAVNENDEVGQQMVQQGEDTELEGALATHARYKSYLTQMFNFQKQAGRSWEDFNRSVGHARADFNLGESRAREDFSRNESRAIEDHNRSKMRSSEDFYRQERYIRKDHNRQERYTQENFDLSMKRLAEDSAGSLMNPFQREQAKPVWSAGGLTQNVREQNKDLNRQSDVLKELSKRGLSDEAIRTLKLSDPGNAQQVFQLEGMSRGEISKLNQQLSKRGRISERFVSSEFNTDTVRAQEDLTTQFERGDEMLDESLARRRKTFRISRRRGDEDFARSLRRSGDDLNRSLKRSSDDLNRDLGRQHDSVTRSLKRTRVDINDSLKGIKGDFRKTMGAVSDISETGTTDWNAIMGGGLDEIGGQFDRSGKRWGKSTSRTIKAVDKVLRKFAGDGKATDYVDPIGTGTVLKNPVGTGTVLRNSGGFEPGGTTFTGGAGDDFTGGTGGDVTDAGKGATTWKDEFNKKQDKLMEGIEKFGTLNNIHGAGANAPGGAGVSANAFQMGKYLMDAGLSRSGAAAVVGNLQHESGLSTSVMSSDGHGSVGLAQWTGSRLSDMRGYTKGMPGGASAWKNQLSFLLHELSSYPSLLNRLSSKGNVNELAYDFEREFERPQPGSHSQRAGYARTVFDGLSNYSGSTTASKEDKNMSIWKMGDEIWRRGRAARTRSRNENNLYGGSGTYKGGVPFRSVSGDWAQPMRGYRLSQGYSSGHPAYDMVPTQGDPTVYAAGAGTINLKKVLNKDGTFRSYGRYITISHDQGIGTLYAHLSAYASGVRSGQRVEAGQRIGRYGNTGRSYGAHLHFAVARGNPEPYSNAIPKSAVGLAKGGIVTRAVSTVLGEGGDHEAVIPLNKGGVETIAEAIAKYSSQYEAKVSRTAPYARPVTNNTYVTDKSTRFTGDITVSAESPDDLVAALSDKQRSDNLFDARS